MSNLFRPVVQDDLDLLSINQFAKSFPGEDVIVYSLENKIYAVKNFACEPKLLKERDSEVNGFLLHNNRLYDYGIYGGLDTLADILNCKRDNSIKDMCSHGGLMYEACEGGEIWCTNLNEILREGDCNYWAICSHGEGIYNTEGDKIYFNGTNLGTFRDQNPTLVAQRPDYVNALFSYAGMLYDGGEYSKVYGTSNSGITYSEWDLRVSDVQGMFAFDDQIYAYNFGGMIYNLFQKTHVHTLFGSHNITTVKADILKGCEI